MIVKKVPNPDKTATKRVRITRLLEYIRTPERDDATEKCIHYGTRGFASDDPADQIAEMAALAQTARRSRDPTNHYVASWPAGERPTPAQVDEAIDIFRQELDIPDLLVAYALHADTENWHAHIVVLRVDPETGKPVQIQKGFDLDAAQRAGALIEHKQGWRATANKRWVVIDGRIAPADPNPQKPDRPRPKEPHERRQPPQRQRDMAHRTEAPSVTQRLIGIVAPILDQDLPPGPDGLIAFHTALEPHGVTHTRRGGGAVFTLGDVTVKASSVDRRATLSALEKRFGLYKAHDPDRAPPAHPLDARPLFADKERRAQIQDWGQLHTALAAYRLRIERKGSGALICSADHDLKASDVHRNASLPRLEKALGPYKPRPPDLAQDQPPPVLDRQPGTAAPAAAVVADPDQQAYAAERAQYRRAEAAARITYQQDYDRKLATLKAKQDAERKAALAGKWKGRGDQLNRLRRALRLLHDAQTAALRDERRKAAQKHRRDYPPWPDYRTWIQDSWVVPGAPSGPPAPVAGIRAYTARLAPIGIAYCHRDRQRRPDFLDTGPTIRFLRRPYDPDAFRAAAQLVVAKGWQGIRIRSRSPEFIGLAIASLVEHGVAVTNPELHDQVIAEQQRQARAAAELQPPPTTAPSTPDPGIVTPEPVQPPAAPPPPQETERPAIAPGPDVTPPDSERSIAQRRQVPDATYTIYPYSDDGPSSPTTHESSGPPDPPLPMPGYETGVTIRKHVHYNKGNKWYVFSDVGRAIAIGTHATHEEILDGLRLAGERFGKFGFREPARSDPPYKTAMCSLMQHLAAVHDLPLVDPPPQRTEESVRRWKPQPPKPAEPRVAPAKSPDRERD